MLFQSLIILIISKVNPRNRDCTRCEDFGCFIVANIGGINNGRTFSMTEVDATTITVAEPFLVEPGTVFVAPWRATTAIRFTTDEDDAT
jgi:hypothetical protein